jgi:hypothetical protein
MSDEERDARNQSRRPFSAKSALHNLLGVPEEPRPHLSYARTLPPVEFLYPTPHLVDDEEVAHDGASFRREIITEPQQKAVIPRDGARAPVEHQLGSGLTPQQPPRQDASAEHAVVSAPRMVPAASSGREDGQSAITAKEGERAPGVEQAGECLAGGPGSPRPSVEGPARGQSIAHQEPSRAEKRAAAGVDTAPIRDRGLERRRQIEGAAGRDSGAIENLRRTVNELTAKIAQSHGRTPPAQPHSQPAATPATAPPIAPQRAVLHPDERWHRRPSGRGGQSGPARAFWQRNYLTRRIF